MVTDEALAYLEWRYIIYLRLLNRCGLAPAEVLPPWYVMKGELNEHG